MTTEEKIKLAIASGSRTGQTIISDKTEVEAVFAKATLRIMVQSGLSAGDEVEFYSMVYGKVPVRNKKGEFNDAPGLTATVFKLQADKVTFKEEQRIVFLAGLVRQDADKGLMGLMSTDATLKAATNMTEFAEAFIALTKDGKRIKVASTWQDPTPRVVSVGGLDTKITNKYLELVMA